MHQMNHWCFVWLAPSQQRLFWSPEHQPSSLLDLFKIFIIELKYIIILMCLILKKKTFQPHRLSSPWQQFSSASQSCPTLCNSMDCNMLDLPVHHQLLAQTHVHSVSDAIQPSHPPSSPSPPALNLSQQQGLFKWASFLHQSIGCFLHQSIGQSIGVSSSASDLPVNIQDWSPLGWTGWIFLQSERLSRAFSNTTVQKHQFFSAQHSSQSKSHIHTLPLEKL